MLPRLDSIGVAKDIECKVCPVPEEFQQGSGARDTKFAAIHSTIHIPLQYYIPGSINDNRYDSFSYISQEPSQKSML